MKKAIHRLKNAGNADRLVGLAIVLAGAGGLMAHRYSSIPIAIGAFVVPLFIIWVGSTLPDHAHSFNEERLQEHLDEAEQYFAEEKYDDVLEALRKARIYGDIPHEYIEYEHVCQSKHNA